jgi:hypothetical protein
MPMYDLSLQWEMTVWADTWYPSWRDPLLAVVVIVAVSSGILLFYLLLSRYVQQLPAAVVGHCL